jgi:hypothetical protein
LTYFRKLLGYLLLRVHAIKGAAAPIRKKKTKATDLFVVKE